MWKNSGRVLERNEGHLIKSSRKYQHHLSYKHKHTQPYTFIQWWQEVLCSTSFSSHDFQTFPAGYSITSTWSYFGPLLCTGLLQVNGIFGCFEWPLAPGHCCNISIQSVFCKTFSHSDLLFHIDENRNDPQLWTVLMNMNYVT